MTDEKRETLIDRMMMAKGDEIRTAREKLGISQAELAARAGTNQQTIDRLERGLTRQSKFMPEIRAALNLDPYVEPEESLVRFSGKFGSNYGVRAHVADEYRDEHKMPVFGMEMAEEGGQKAWVLLQEPVTYIPRAYPVEGQLGAYGIVVPDERMSPVLKKGDIAVVNPDAAPEFGGEVFMLHGMTDGRTAGMLCTWIGFEDQEDGDKKERFRRVKFYNPHEAFLARFLTWPAMGSIVAKFPMPRN
ncbi:helix-turn-helix domain-containing protein [Rhizobium sp. YIM 134829]|uniref:helix-turn-helix domain-containing protein n=1 Tax=Rhizobium sp. YIM 134829 TaxID=3390453 RepID=UPI00397D6BBA